MRTLSEALDRLAELEWALHQLRAAARSDTPAPPPAAAAPTNDSLSVVIVSRDQGRLVDATLDSVRQTLRPRELIVADAGGGLFTRQRLQQLRARRRERPVAQLRRPRPRRQRGARARDWTLSCS